MITKQTKYSMLKQVGVIILSVFLLFSCLLGCVGSAYASTSKDKTVTKTFQSLEDAKAYEPSKTIDENGDEYELVSSDIKEPQNVYSYTYRSEEPFSFKADQEKSFTLDNGKTATGKLVSTSPGNIYRVKIEMPAKFHGPANSKYYILGEKKVFWNLNAAAPECNGYEDDILSHLKLDKKNYRVTGGYWTSDTTKGNVRTRTAVFTGTKGVRDYTATYDVSSSPNYEVKVISKYKLVEDEEIELAKPHEEEGMSLAMKILIGVGIAVIAAAIASLLYYFAKRRREESDEAEDL